MTDAIRLHIGSWSELRAQAMPVRLKVFVDEQAVPLCLEWDEADASATHIVATRGDQAIATGRLLPDGQIGRMAVLQPYRTQGIGGRLLDALIRKAAEQSHHSVWLNAQVQALAFYQHHGFVAEGPVFDDAGIPHRRMSRPIG